MNELTRELVVQAQYEFRQHYDWARRADMPIDGTWEDRLVKLVVERCALCASDEKSVQRMHEQFGIQRSDKT